MDKGVGDEVEDREEQEEVAAGFESFRLYPRGVEFSASQRAGRLTP